MKIKLRVVIIVVCAIAVLLYSFHTDLFHVYILRDDNGGTMLWNSDEAYLFMKVVRRGYRMNYAEYAWDSLLEWFGAVSRPHDQRVFLYVIHVTPSGYSRHLALITNDTAGIPSSFTPLGRTIFTFCSGTLCK